MTGFLLVVDDSVDEHALMIGDEKAWVTWAGIDEAGKWYVCLDETGYNGNLLITAEEDGGMWVYTRSQEEVPGRLVKAAFDKAPDAVRDYVIEWALRERR